METFKERLLRLTKEAKNIEKSPKRVTGLSNPIKRHGGKFYLAKKIIPHFPPHLHYVEPFFGGGSVLLQKDFIGYSEVINDLDSQLITFWKVLRDNTEEFFQKLECTPFSEELFEKALKNLEDTSTPSLQAAVDFFIVARQSRQGLMKSFATLVKNRTRAGMSDNVSAYLSSIDGLWEVSRRLQRVVILNRAAVNVINTQDGPNTLVYADPPYLKETRLKGNEYKHEMSTWDHEELLEALSIMKGKFVLSGYDNALYEFFRDRFGWRKVEIEVPNHSSSKKEKEIKVECLWMNY